MFINQNKHTNHTFFMELALAQAQKYLGNTKENPSVGCVLVKNGHVISAGHTGEGGRPHAEQNAINFSRITPEKSELYVTLEPCSHYGQTPPCVKLIIKSNKGVNVGNIYGRSIVDSSIIKMFSFKN